MAVLHASNKLDSLGRLCEKKRGTLASGGASISSDITLTGVDKLQTWTLDSVGNWKSFKKIESTDSGDTSSIEYRQHNKLHQITKVGSQAVAYDSNGNVTADGTRILKYDAFNRICEVQNNSETTLATYVYDALGRRIQKTVSNGGLDTNQSNGTTDYLYSGIQCVEERQSNSTARQYIWGRYVDELIQQRNDPDGTPADYYPLQDLLYRTQALTDSSGNIVEVYDYDAYGTLTIFDGTAATPDSDWWDGDETTSSTSTCDFLFTGRRWDAETGLYFYRARTYNAELGRFIQKDPLMYVDGMGLYEYVGSKSVGILDPMGNFGFDDFNRCNPVTNPMCGITEPEYAPDGGEGGETPYEGCLPCARRIRTETTQKFRQANHDNFMRHCVGSCEVSKQCGNWCAFISGWANEFAHDFEWRDVTANKAGRNAAECKVSCEEACTNAQNGKDPCCN